VTAVAGDAQKLHALDLDTSLAWQAYSERLSGLDGEEYDRAEQECWSELQRELRQVERKRQLLAGTTV
jgi:hypothetical protein